MENETIRRILRRNNEDNKRPRTKTEKDAEQLAALGLPNEWMNAKHEAKMKENDKRSS